MSSLMPGPLPAGTAVPRPDPSGADDVGAEECCEVVVTAADVAWLADFTRTLVEERLAACGHLLDGVRSIYRWQGSVEDEPEARVALHTRLSLVPAITARADALHPYEVPCVIAMPLVGGNPVYLQWITEETRAPGSTADAPPISG